MLLSLIVLTSLTLTSDTTRTVFTPDKRASVRMVLVPAPKSGYTRLHVPGRPESSHTGWRGTRVWGVQWSHRDLRTGKWNPLELPRARSTRVSNIELRSNGRRIQIPKRLYQSLFDANLDRLTISQSRNGITVYFSGSDGGGAYFAKFIVTRSSIERQTGQEGHVEEKLVVKQRNRL